MGAMISKKKLYPFNAEQTVNILSEFGPLVMMFIVNALYGINAGTWALILSTAAAIIAMLRHYVEDREFIYGLDLKHLDEMRARRREGASHGL